MIDGGKISCTGSRSNRKKLFRNNFFKPSLATADAALATSAGDVVARLKAAKAMAKSTTKKAWRMVWATAATLPPDFQPPLEDEEGVEATSGVDSAGGLPP